MKNKFCITLGLMAILFGPVLKAEMTPASKPIVTNLEEAREHLKALSKEIKDPALLKRVQKAIRRADYVITAGPGAVPELAEIAITSAQKVLTLINQKKQAKHQSSSSSSSSTSSSSSSASSASRCDAPREISEIESEVKDCCQTIQQEIAQIVAFLNSQMACDDVMVINSVPTVISASGKYCVTKDLVYNGPNTAITVTADNVSINFHNHSLTLTDSSAVGILAQNVSEFTLENDIITGSNIFRSSTSAAIHLDKVQKATLNNVYTKNTTRGIEISNSSDIRIVHSHVEAHEGNIEVIFPSPASLVGTGNGAGIWVSDSTSIEMDNCTFTGADLVADPTRTSFGLHVEGASENITLTNSSFTDWLGSIHVVQVNGLLVDHCNVNASPVSSFNMVQLGSCDEGNHANDVIIRNSNFVQKTAVQGFDGVLIVAGESCILDNLLIDTVSQDIVNGYLPSALHIGITGCDPYENLIATNCIVKGVNGRTVHIENGQKVTLDACQISGGTNVNVFMTGALNCVVKNSSVFGGDSGFFLVAANGAGKNSVENCLVFDNVIYGIQVSDQTANLVAGNSVWGSRVGIYLSFSGFTQTYFNTVCNNSIDNCTNVSPAQLPGDNPAYAGSNVCCNP